MSTVWLVVLVVGIATVALKATGPVLLGDRELPEPVARLNTPGTAAHWSGAIGSTTIFAPAGMLAIIQSRASWRVSSRARTRSLWTE